LREVISIIDAHIHLSFVPAEKRVEFFAAGRATGISHYVQGGYNPTDWQEQLKLQKEFGGITTCFGLHPWHIRDAPPTQLETDFTELTRMVKRTDFIGETGIDRFHEIPEEKDRLQVEYFRRHLQLAQEAGKPVVLHIVQAHTEALEILGEFSELRGIVHGFSGAHDLAERYLKLGYFISVGPGVLAEKGYRKLKEAVVALPLTAMTIESDSPQSPQDLSPNPRLILDVATAVARLKGVSREKVLQASNENLRRLVNLG
jgi:TatD DNase family protein